MNKRVFSLAASLLLSGSLFCASAQNDVDLLDFLKKSATGDTVLTLENKGAYEAIIGEDLAIGQATADDGSGKPWGNGFKVTIDALSKPGASGSKVTIKAKEGTNPVVTGRIVVLADTVVIDGIEFRWSGQNLTKARAFVDFAAKSATITNNKIVGPYTAVNVPNVGNCSMIGFMVYPHKDAAEGSIVLSGNTVENLMGYFQADNVSNSAMSIGVSIGFGHQTAGVLGTSEQGIADQIATAWKDQVVVDETNTFTNCLINKTLWDGTTADKIGMGEVEFDPLDDNLLGDYADEVQKQFQEEYVKNADNWNSEDKNKNNPSDFSFLGGEDEFKNWLGDYEIENSVVFHTEDGDVVSGTKAPSVAPDTIYTTAGKMYVLVKPEKGTKELSKEQIGKDRYYVLAFGANSGEGGELKSRTDTFYIANAATADKYSVVRTRLSDYSKKSIEGDSLLLDLGYYLKDGLGYDGQKEYGYAGTKDSLLWNVTAEENPIDEDITYVFTNKKGEKLTVNGGKYVQSALKKTKYGVNGVPVAFKANTTDFTIEEQTDATKYLMLGLYRAATDTLNNEQFGTVAGNGMAPSEAVDEDPFEGKTLIPVWYTGSTKAPFFTVENDDPALAKKFYLACDVTLKEAAPTALTDAEIESIDSLIVATATNVAGKDEAQWIYGLTKVAAATLAADLAKTKHEYYGEFQALFEPLTADDAAELANADRIDTLKVNLPKGWGRVGSFNYGNGKKYLGASVATLPNDVTFAGAPQQPQPTDRIDVDALLTGKFAHVEFANTKDKGDKDQKYKFGDESGTGLLAVVYDETDRRPEPKFIVPAKTNKAWPETQWAVSKVIWADDNAAEKNLGLAVLTNREDLSVKDSLILYQSKSMPRDEYAVHAVVVNGALNTIDSGAKTNSNVCTNDTLKISFDVTPGEFDGFWQIDSVTLRNKVYNIAAHLTDVDMDAWWYEKEPNKTHQIGLNSNMDELKQKEKSSQGRWNLYQAERDTLTVVSTLYTKNGSTTSTLKVLKYAIQNAGNSEFVKYNPDNSYEYLICDPENKEFGGSDDEFFALKLRPDSTYHIVRIVGNQMEDKVYHRNSDAGGSLNTVENYSVTSNDLMKIREEEQPEYRLYVKGKKELGDDTIKIFREKNPAEVLWEKELYKNAGLYFLNVDNTYDQKFDIHPALYVDTAYIHRGNNARWQYLLAVEVNKTPAGWYCPKDPKHNEDWWIEANGGPCHDAVPTAGHTDGRYLVNLIDTANAYAKQPQMHENPFVNEAEAGDHLAKLAFVPARHIGDTLVIYVADENGNETFNYYGTEQKYSVKDSLNVGTADFNIAKFAFRYEDADGTGSFKIQTYYDTYVLDGPSSGVNHNEGYLRLVNGTVVVAPNYESGEVFNLEPLEGVTPTENESIATGNVTVAGADGAVIVKGAEGKTVIVTTILGKVVANEVLTSDNATVAAPAGIVVVSVDGESYKVVVR